MPLIKKQPNKTGWGSPFPFERFACNADKDIRRWFGGGDVDLMDLIVSFLRL